MTKRRGVTEKATKAAKTTKTIRTYIANSSRDYNKKEMKGERKEVNIEQDNLHGQDVDIGEGNNRQDDDIERIILERRENEKKEMERKIKREEREKKKKKERREKEKEEGKRERGRGERKIRIKRK
ncbi:hypothetical protein GLOIN_2v1479627 [Rhizophagus clarus]|uniref:Uncharacterized protein n=1 Tax=Rhizophagus clarus TaxID=94130 RepID=A0A8H3M8D3_9GLOM|nr:hypothetical protein GLOIN_2v1479627 [Rhizophagus clarus]